LSEAGIWLSKGIVKGIQISGTKNHFSTHLIVITSRYAFCLFYQVFKYFQVILGCGFLKFFEPFPDFFHVHILF
jgi:hypothetical protein